MRNTRIEWADHTFNPWEGCTRVSPGCDNCYAAARNIRFSGGVNWGPSAPRRHTSRETWQQPLKWNAECDSSPFVVGGRPRVFCASLADVFDNEVPSAWRRELFHLILRTPNLDWLLLTKRIGNAAEMLDDTAEACGGYCWPFHNVWIGATVVNQAEADRDVPKLLAVPAARRFLSVEPMLGLVDVRQYLGGHRIIRAGGSTGPVTSARVNGIDWVICGGESGPHARPMHPDWARSLRDQCNAAGVPFFFKQWGEWLPGHQYTGELQERDCGPDSIFRCAEWDPIAGWVERDCHPSERDEHAVWRVGKRAAGRLLDGRTWDEVLGGGDR